MRVALWPTLILCAIALSGGAACAQAFTPDPVDEAAAKREGAVTWYTSTPVRAAQYIATEFERPDHTKVEFQQLAAASRLSAASAEVAAGRFAADVITMSDMSAANDMARHGRFVPFRPVGFDKVIPDAKDPDGTHRPALTMVGMLVRNGRRWRRPIVPPPGAISPPCKGMLVMADPAFTAIQLVVVMTTVAARLVVLRPTAQQRHHDRAKPRADLRHRQARRAADRGRILRPPHLYGRRAASQHGQHQSAQRRHRSTLADRHHQGDPPHPNAHGCSRNST